MSDTISLEQIQHDGGMRALCSYANDLRRELVDRVDRLWYPKDGSGVMFPDYQTRIAKIRELLSRLESVIEYTQAQQPQPKEDK